MTGISIHIGINRVDDKSYYPLVVPDLVACENDAVDMQAIAEKIGYKTSTILSENATYEAVKNAIAGAASQLKSGDIFLLTYSGHGSQVFDRNNDRPQR